MSDPAAKPRMPDNLRELALAAKARVGSRRTTGPLEVVRDMEGSAAFVSPYADEDEHLWLCLLCDCFGTRLPGVVMMFLRQLRALMPDVWTVPEGEIAGHHEPDREAMEQALNVLCDLRPRDTVQASMAAQAVALHLSMMRVSDQMGSHRYLHPQSAGGLAALSKAYDAKVRALKELQTGGRAKRQVIKVQKNVQVNYNDNRSVNVTPPAGKPSERQALPCPDAGGEVVSFPSRARPRALQAPRWGEGDGSAER